MATYRALPAELDLIVAPADQSVTLNFASAGAPYDASGVWVAKVRSSTADATADLTLSVDTTGAAAGQISVALTEAQLAGLIPAGAAEFSGVWGAQRDGVPWFAGLFIVRQKAPR